MCPTYRDQVTADLLAIFASHGSRVDEDATLLSQVSAGLAAMNSADHRNSGMADLVRSLFVLITWGFHFAKSWHGRCITPTRVRQRKAPNTDKPMRRNDTIETDPSIT